MIAGFECLDLFTHQVWDGRWVVDDAVTGRYIGLGNSEIQAITAAKDKLERMGLAKNEQEMIGHIEVGHITSRYSLCHEDIARLERECEGGVEQG